MHCCQNVKYYFTQYEQNWIESSLLFSLLLAQLIYNYSMSVRLTLKCRDHKLMYISDNSKQNCSFCTFNLLVEQFGHCYFKTIDRDIIIEFFVFKPTNESTY